MPVTQYAYNVNGGYSNEIQNAPGAPFVTIPGQAPTALGAVVTPHLERYIFNKIMGTEPEPYFASLRLFMFGQTPVEVPLDQYTWSEKPSQRYALNADDGASPVGTEIVAAIPGVSGAYQTYDIPIPDADLPYVALNNDIMFRNQGYGTIIAKTTGSPSTITVRSLVSAGLPAVLQGDRLPLMGEIRADGMENIVNVQRISTVERSNYVATFMRSTKWGRKEQLNWKNGGTTDYMEKNEREVMLDLKYDALVNFWAGKKEMRLLAGNTDYAKGMDGIDPQMRAGGSATATTSLGNLIATFESMGHNTNYQARSGTRYVFARQELLTILSKEYKSLQTRYTPNDMVANMDLDKIKYGGQNYVLVPVEPFGDVNYFQTDWADRMYVIDTGCVQTIKQKGLPFMDINGMMDNHLQSFRDNPRSLRDYKVWSAEINISLKMYEPRGSYIITVV